MLESAERHGPLELESITKLQNSGADSGTLESARRPAIQRDRRPGRRGDGANPQGADLRLGPARGPGQSDSTPPRGRGETARAAPVHTKTALTRRAFLKGGSLLTASGILFLATPQNLLAAEPGFNRYNNVQGDFAAHIREIESGGRNVAGSDYAFLHGIPVTSPVAGKVRYVQDFKYGTAAKGVVIEYGIVDIQISHLERLLVGRGDALDRNTCIGTQGKNTATGGKAAVSHLHMSVYGCGAFYDYRQTLRTGGRSRAYFLLNPDRLTPRRGPRLNLTDSPWDGETDYDTPYLAYVDAHVRAGLARVARNYPNQPLARSIGRWLRSRSLAETLRRAWDGHQRDRQPGSALAREIESVFEHVKTAGGLLKLTSPYIDHTNAKTILRVAAANPEPARSLILDPRFYGRYVPRRTAGSPAGSPPA